MPNTTRKDFGHAQMAWQASQHCHGFAGQIGGWQNNSNNTSSTAYILTFWQNQQCLDDFMRYYHDDIVAANQQHLYYQSCRVDILTSCSPLNKDDHHHILDNQVTRLYVSQWQLSSSQVSQLLLTRTI